MASDTTTAPPAPVSAATDDATDPFRRLHKMSTTAGVGAGDYVAISGLAIAAVLVGVASATVLFGWKFLLIIPLAGIGLAVAAWVGIGRSNGTLTGRGLAVIGLLLSLGLGLYQGSRAAVAAARDAADERQVRALIHDFGDDVANERYTQAYARCDDTFHQIVAFPAFEGTWKASHSSKVLGTLTGIEWNGQLQFDADPITGERVGGGMVLVQFDGGKQSARTDMFFHRANGAWKVDRIPQLFQPPAPPQQPKPIPSGSAPKPPPGVMGPIRP